MDKLNVIAVVSNPVRFKRRYELYKQFEKYVKANPEVNLLTVEQAFGERPFEITDRSNPWHLQLRTENELWAKENMINLGVAHLSRINPDWKYVAWVDADVTFARPDWAEETVHQLQHYHVVQMFRYAHDLGPNNETIENAPRTGFVYRYFHSEFTETSYSKPYQTNFNKGLVLPDYYGDFGIMGWHPGYAWATTKDAWNHMGGLIDYAILGNGDLHMAAGWIGQIHRTFHGDMLKNNPRFAEKLLEWQDRCEKYILHDVGYVDGSLLHYWHGKKAARGYQDRSKIITQHKYNPDIHLKVDHQGMYQLTDKNIMLRDDIRRYFRSRSEDSIDL